MSNRYEKIGMKHVIRLEWMDRVVTMLLEDRSVADIRKNLDEYLSTQKQSGGPGERGKQAYPKALGILSAWFSPTKELQSFRDDALKAARKISKDRWLPLHWAVISASYPFWFNVAKQVGRLLNLQDRITQKQVFNRLKEQYGDRETVARSARYTVRSFIAWGVLKDTGTKGWYKKGKHFSVTNNKGIMILLESGLLTFKDGTSPLGILLNSPGFFPFGLSSLTRDFIARNSPRMDVAHFGMDDELLRLKFKDYSSDLIPT